MATILTHACAGLALLTLAASASAECAWVLWDGDLRADGWSWSISSAHPTARECSDDLLALAQIIKKDGGEIHGAHQGSREAIYKTRELNGKLLCLPDTVDPRGTKGK